MFEGIIIVGIVMSILITAIIRDHKRRVVKIKAEMIRDEIEAEKLGRQNFIVETEKMNLDYTTGQNYLL